MKNFHDEQESGFSLVEIMVGVIIIGIIASIAVVVGINQRQKAIAAKSDLAIKTLTKEINDSKIRVLTSSGYKQQYTSPSSTETNKNFDRDIFNLERYAYVNGQRVSYVDNKKFDGICYLIYNKKDTYNAKYRQTVVVTPKYPEGKITKGSRVGCPTTA